MSVGGGVGEAEVPLADHAGVIAAGLEELGQGGAFTFDERVALDAEEDPMLERGAPAITTNEQSITDNSATKIK